MRIRRSIFALAGLGSVAAAIFVPHVVAFRIAALVDTVGNDYILVGLVAGIGILLGAVALFSGRPTTLRQAELPEPEGPMRGAVPGSTLDTALDVWWIDLPIVGRRRRERVRSRLHSAAIGRLMQSNGCSREQASELLANGMWTDDPQAVAFFEPHRGSILAWLQGIHRGESVFERRANRVIDVLATDRSPEATARVASEPSATHHSPTEERELSSQRRTA